MPAAPRLAALLLGPLMVIGLLLGLASPAGAQTDPPPLALNGVPDQLYTVGTPVNLVLPAATGASGELTYTLTGALPAGLTFDAVSRTLSGTPSTAAEVTELTYTVSDDGNNPAASMSRAFNVTVSDPDEPGATIGLITGDAEVGQTLTAGMVTDPAGAVTVINYRWQSAPEGTADDDPAWANIDFLNRRSFIPRTVDVGMIIRVVVTYYTGSDFTVPKTIASAATGAVAAAPTLPVIMGSVTLEIPENTSHDTLLGTYTTTADIDRFGIFTNVLDGSLFRFNSTSGKLFFKNGPSFSPDFEAPRDQGANNVYNLTVVGLGSDFQPATQNLEVTVTITNVDEPGAISAITGDAQVGATLTAGTVTDEDSPSDGTPVSGITHQWQSAVDGTDAAADVDDAAWPDISGATGATYDPVVGDVGRIIRVVATYTDGEGGGKKVASAATGAVAAAPALPLITGPATLEIPENTAAPTVLANYATTATLTGGGWSRRVSGNDADGILFRIAPTGPTSAQLATNAVGSPFVPDYEAPQDVDADNVYKVTIYARAAGSLDPVTQDLEVTVTVTNVDEPGAISTITGDAQVGATLTAGTVTDEDSPSDGTPVSGITHQWQSAVDGTDAAADVDDAAWPDISGATGATYDPVVGDVGRIIRVVATYTDGEGGGKKVASAATGAVAAAPLALPDPPNQGYTMDTAITALVLPEATGGTTPRAYTLTGPAGAALPAGLSFNAGTRTLSGTPGTAASTELTYTVTDANGATATADFTVTVNAGLVLTPPDDQFYTLGTLIAALELPPATGGTAPLTYALTNLPDGLRFDAGTRTLSGTPGTADVTVLTYTVTDANGATATADFTVTVNAGLALSAPPDQGYTVNTAIDALILPEASGGTGTLRYTLTGPGAALPDGLAFDAGTRTLSGTPGTAASTELTYTVTDANGATTSQTFMVTVNDSLALPAPDDQSYTLDTAIDALILPEATGGTAPLTYALTDPPAGLTFNSASRRLTGTPTAAAITELTYTVTDANDASTSQTFTVTVNDGLALNAPGAQGYTLDTTITDLELPEATGGTAPLTYALTDPPAGLTFNSASRRLTGTPTAAAITELTYTVTDANDASTSQTFTVTVNDGLALNAPGAQGYTLDTTITDLELPEATGGTAPLIYALTDPPAGLAFNPTSRTLSGTPTAAASTVLTYTVTDTNDATASQTFTVTVNDGLVLTTAGDQGYTLGTTITELELPAATGGTAPLTYALTNLPDGLRFDAGTRTLSGTPGTAATTELTYTVTDANGATATADFTVTVNAGLVLTPPDDQFYTLGTLIAALELPPATGGTALLTYALTNLPDGLAFDAGTRTLSGTPGTAASTELTYTVTDANGATTSQTFMVTVNDSLALSAPPAQSYTAGTLITPLALSAASGGTGTLSYTLTGPAGADLPDGLDFNAGTRTLSGTPTAAASTVLTYTVTDTNDATASQTFTVTVNDGLVLTTAGDQGYTLGTTITELELPAATGGTAPLTYALTNLPDGLRFDAGTRTLSGTPGTAAITELTYTVTDANDATTSQTFMVTVSDGLALSAPPAQSYTAGTLITPLALSAATGGTGTLSYTLTGPAGADLPTGLTFTAASRTLSGTPTAAASTVLTYTVTDTNDATASQTFTVTVNDGLVLTTAGDQGYTLGTTITELELPAATGGTAPLIYALTDPPAGLAFNPTNRTLSGTPGTAAITELTYTVTDANGASTSQTFMVTVNDSLALTAPDDQSYTVDTAITDLVLLEATGGTGTLSYTLTGPAGADLPTGLTFTAASRTLSGTPTAAASTVLTYTVTDANGASTSQTFTVTVNDGLVLTTAGDQGYTLGTTITELELPAATGGTAPLTYTLTGLPTGLTFTAASRTLSGTPTAAASTVLTYTVTDTNDATASQTFTVTVNDGLVLTAPDDQSYTLDTAIDALILPEATGGTAPLTYALTDPPDGLRFDAGTRTLSGTPGTAASTELTYTVTDANGASTSQTFMVTVNDSLALTAPDDQSYTVDTAITNLVLLEASGGTGTLSYTLTGALPTGLTFTAASRTLSGTPTAAAITVLTYTVTDTNDATASQTFTVTVNDGLALSAAGDQGYTLGTTITDLELPAATGGTAPLIYALTDPPAGLAFNPTNRTLSGTPGTAAITELTYTVTDANGASTSQTFMVTVNDSLALTAPDDQSYTVDTAITDLVLLEATGGTGTLSYTLTGPAGADLPTGLAFNPTNRTLSGTPTAAASTELTYTVTDANDASTSQTFTVTVNDGLVLTTAGDQGYTLDTAIDALILPEATGGTAPLTYALTDPPAGLTFNSASRRLTGTPTAAAITELTYTVTDANGASTSQTFMVTVNDSLALTAPDDQSYTVDTAITDLVLLEASGGTGTLTYTLTGLPTGLTFTAASRTLSGTPTAAASTVLTYTVTDANGASTSQTFTVTVNDGLVLTTAGDQGYTLDTAIDALILPEATGGTAPLTYALTDPPDGLRFDAGTRTLSGTPGTAAITELTYTVTDANGASTSQTFDVTVNDGVTLPAPGDQGYTLDTAIDALILPEATGGTAPLTYALTDPPDGLRFDAGTRTLSGTPGTAASTELTYTVTDANGASTSQTFMVTVNDSLALTAPDDQSYTVDTAITNLVLLEASGGTGTLTYTLTGALPTGLTFTAASRTLSGTPTAAASTVLTYTVTDTNDATASQTFTVTVNDGLVLTTAGDQGYTLGTTITELELPAATGGTAPLTYALTDPPAGLAFNPTNRTLSGTPGTAAITELTYTVTDANGASTSQTFMVTVNDSLALTAPDDQGYTVDTAITDLVLLEASGGTGTLSYTLTGALPTGLTFTAASRTLSGTPTAAASTVLTYTVTDTNDATASQTFTVTVNDGLALSAAGDQGYTLGTTITELELPEATGGTAPLIYALTDPPAGLAFNPTNRTLSGTSGTAAITELTYTVTDANGASTSQTFMVTVNDSLALTAPDDQSYTVDTAITDLVLLEATGGTGTLSYTLTGPAGADLPTGLTFTAASRTLSGTPTAAASTVLTYTVTDANGASTSQTFTVTVNDGLVLTTAGDQGYTLGTTITDLELPAATGGTAPLTYALTNLPDGLRFDAGTRTLSGTPGTAASTELTYTVTDANDASTSQTFTVTVNDGLALNAPGAQGYTLDTAIDALILPEATGGTAPLTYALTDPPAGLTFNSASRRLTGTPTAAAITELTYTVTDANDASTSQTFTVTVNDGLVLTTAGDQGYTLDTAIDALILPEATGGTAPLTYALTDPLAGLTFNSASRRLTGTPTAAAITELTYTVTDANGASTSQTFMVTVNDSLALTAPDDQSYTVDTAITDLVLLEASGGTGTLTYTLTGLPTGLTFTAASRTLSGTPTAAASTVLTYTVTDANGASTSQTFTVTVNDGLVLTTAGDQGYTLDTAIDALILPEATGGTAPLTYALTDPPDGLRFDAGTRTLSGTPGTAAITELTYTVTDANGASTSQTFDVTVNDGVTLPAPGDQGYTLDTAIDALILPEATGGTAPLTYALTDPPAGLTFNSASRRLTGTPTAAAITELTYTVTDANDASTSQTFTVTVNDGLALNAPGAQGYTLDTTITDLELPEATGGTAPLIYALTDPPAGLAFNPTSRTLSGTPGMADVTVLTYTVTDANDATTSQTFMVTVSDGLALSAPPAQSYTAGTLITPLALSAATGGTGTPSYTLTGPAGADLPTGLTFTAASRTLSGTPTAAASTVLTYTVTDTNDATASQTFTVTVNDGLALNAPGAQGYTLDTAIDALILPEATGGTAPLTYALTDPPAGLTFNSASRRLTGTPTAAAITELTYTVTDTNDATASQTFTVTVNDGLALNAPGAQGYTLDTAITDLELPEATGGTAPLTYALTDPPDGLRFDAGTRTLSGTPGTAAITELTYTVTDANDASTSQTFTVTVNGRLVLSAAVDNQGYTVDTAIDALILPEATGGTAPLTYALTDPPDGLRFDAGTRTLSGTPGTAAITELTYTVTDANGASTSQTFMVTVNDSLALTAPDDQSYTVDTAITDLALLEASGGTGTLTYTLTGPGAAATLPDGLTFTAGTRMLSGTPTVAAITELTYTVTDANDASTSQTFTVTVNDGLALNAPGAQGYTLDTTITELELPEATGGTAPLIYALTDPPAGLAFNPTNRTLSGTPGTAAITELTYTVTDANGASTSQTFMVTVNDSLALTAPDDQSYTVDTAITDLVLLEATGGTGTLSYTLTGPAGADLPTGLTFTAASRTLSGTPTAAASTVLTYTVTDANGASTSQTFTVTVNDGLVLTTAGDQGYTLGTTITELELPAATGGTAPLIYALTDPPAGLAFNPTNRTLSGTPGTAAITELTYTVTDANGASTSQTFMVTVNDSLALTAPDDQGYTVDTAIDALILPEATGGTAPLTYALTDPPAGLTFNSASRRLTGTPTAAAITELTYTVTDANDASTSQTFTVTVNDGLALNAPGAQGYTLDTTITDLELLEASGGTGTLRYTLTGPGGAALPTGLTFDAGTGMLSGTPGTAAITTLTYTVTDDNGATASQTFTVTVNDGLALNAPGDQSYTVNTAIDALVLLEATGGTAPLRYALTGALPAGLAFTAASRTLSGTPTAVTSATTLTYTVTDANGATTSQTFTVTVNDGLALNAPGDQSYTVNTAIDALVLLEATGGTAPLRYALTGALPAGLAFTAGTRTLSGTPTAVTSATTLTYTVTDANGATTSQTFTVAVNASLALNPPGAQGYTLDTEIAELVLPEASGGTGTLRYTLTGALPAGLSFNAGTRTLSGTPTAAASTVLTYTVTDANRATTSQTFMVTVSDGLALSAPPAQSYTAGTLITPLALSAATGGTGTLSYTLTGPAGADLPTGLTFTAASRTLSGTPTAAASTVLTYTVTDTNDATASQTFTVTVNDGLVLTTAGDQGYTLGTTITELELPAATGGTAPLTYALTNLPDGLRFDAGTRTLSGTPGMADVTVLTYTVTDANDATTSQTFMVTVSDGLALSAPDDQSYTVDTAITDLALLEASGGTGTLSYTLTGALPTGLTFTAASRTLSGTPTAAASTVLTYTVTDTNDATASQTFTVTVNDGLVLTTAGDQGYTLGTTTTELELPAATGGTAPLTYALTDPPDGLRFDAGTRTLSGTPGTAASTELTYTVTDANDATATADFTVTVAEGLALALVADQSYTVDTAITDLILPAATGGTGTLSYTLTGPAGGALPTGLTFDTAPRRLTGTPTAMATTTLTYTVTDANGATATADFTVTVALPRFADLNRTILPEVARAIAGHTVGAIARRVTQARADGVTDSAGSFNLGGQTTVAGVAGALASHGQAMADGTLSLKDLLGGGDFVLPLNARAAAGAPGLSSLAFWGAGDYSNLDGSGGAVDWDGDLFSAHLGADARLRDDLLVGLAVSWSRVDLDYSDPGRSGDYEFGDYELDLTSFHPYVGWSALSGKLDLWATVGYGWGDLEIADDEAQQASSDVEMRTVAVGGLGRLLKVGATTLRLKGDALLTEMEVEGSDEMAGLTVDARRVRMILEGSRTHTLADGAQLEPSLEVGVRHDGGDGETGFWAELGGGVRYSNPVMGLTLEGRARTLVGRDSYGEWGVNGLIRLERGNGRGLSFNLSPGYGETGSGTQRLWQQGVHDKIDGERDYGARMDLRLGYGLPAFGGRGLLTPYSEVTFGDSARNYRLGMEWELGALFELNLTGERHESSDGAADHAIMLKGEVRF